MAAIDRRRSAAGGSARAEAQQPFREVGEDAVDPQRDERIDFRLAVHGPHAHLEVSPMRFGHRRRARQGPFRVHRFRAEVPREVERLRPRRGRVDENADPRILGEVAHQAHARRGERGEDRLREEAEAAYDAHALDLEPARRVLAFDLEVQLDVPAEELDGLLEGEDLFACELLREPAACIERFDLAQRMVSHAAVAVGRTIQPLVVDHHDGAVASHLAVELDHVGAELDGAKERGTGVLGAMTRGAAMRDAQQTGPVKHRATLAERGVESDRPVWHDPVMRRWLELSIEVVPAAGDALVAWLVDRGAPGVIEEELTDRLRLKAHFTPTEEAEAIVVATRRFLRELDGPFPGAASARLEVGFVDEEDWASSWKQGFPPLEIGRRLCVRTPWSPPPSDRHDVQILPAMAFGTGQHASTLGCLLAIEDVFDQEPAPSAVLDVGTGSGVLAIAAARLGARRVLAIDVDPVAIAAAADNVSRNDLQAVVTLRCGPADAVEGRYPLIVANLYADLLCSMFGAFTARAEDRGRCIVSGLLDADASSVRQTAAASGWQPEAERSLEGWTTLTLRRTP